MVGELWVRKNLVVAESPFFRITHHIIQLTVGSAGRNCIPLPRCNLLPFDFCIFYRITVRSCIKIANQQRRSLSILCKNIRIDRSDMLGRDVCRFKCKMRCGYSYSMSGRKYDIDPSCCPVFSGSGSAEYRFPCLEERIFAQDCRTEPSILIID